MRCAPFAALIGLGCVTTSVAHFTCAFTEIAIVKARRETWMVSDDAAVDALRSTARELGGDAVVRLAFGNDTEVTGTVIRFERPDCKQ